MAPGTSDSGPGIPGASPEESGTRENKVPAARPASPSAPSPMWALRRITSVTPGGDAGTGRARGTIAFPGSRPASGVPVTTSVPSLDTRL